jgi:hypothetical protein
MSASPREESNSGNGANSTPSPSASATNSVHSASRRPPRKSTLTQQQKNQKRQRATQDQLATLEVEFNKNPTPTATVRERIAEDINMTERSVQIWFQNRYVGILFGRMGILTCGRRAKIKLLAKKGIETGEDIDSIPESMRQYLAMQSMEPGKAMGGNFLGRGGLTPYGGGLLLGGDQGPQGKVGKSSMRNLIETRIANYVSDSPFILPCLDGWFLEANWPKCHGFDYLLLS